MGGLQPADPGNAIGRGVKRVWLYLKLLCMSESTGILTLFWNNQVCTTTKPTHVSHAASLCDACTFHSCHHKWPKLEI